LDPQAVFGLDKYARLVGVKRRHDPGSVFHIDDRFPPG
jgi:hypothetical protein